MPDELELSPQNRVAIQVDQEEFPSPSDSLDRLADQCGGFGRCPANGERSGHRHRRDRASCDRRVERLGDDRQIGGFGHSPTIVAAERRVLDSPGPKRQDS